MGRSIDKVRKGFSGFGPSNSSRYWPVVRGWLGFSIILTVLGLLLYATWLLSGSGAAFLLAITGLFLVLFGYSVSHSSSIGNTIGWFSEPDGILLLALLFAFTVSLIVILL